MNRYLSAAALSLALAVPASAGGSVSLYFQPGSRDAAQALRTGLALYALSEGLKSSGHVSQNGNGNAAGLSQAGAGHRGYIHQDGNGHTATLSQKGRGNRFGLFQFGAGATADVVQSGRGRSGLLLQYGF